MDFELSEDLSTYTVAEINDLVVKGNGLLDELFAAETPTDEQVAAAEQITAAIASLEAEAATRDDRTTRMAALRESRVVASNDDPEAPAEDGSDDEDGDDEEEVVEETAPVVVEQKVTKAAPKVTAAVRKVPRPVVPAASRGRVLVTAAADVPEFATGSAMDNVGVLAQAAINRMRGFAGPAGIEGGAMQNFAVASIRRPFPTELTIEKGSDDTEVIDFASREKRLPGNSLVAAGGWCAPSETLYDFCDDANTDGLISVPEVAVTRGGIRFTHGPDWSSLYESGPFLQTEAQAIAGATKPCVSLECPEFEDVRLDAIGICVKVPILTNAAYPELVNSMMSNAIIAQQHFVAKTVITRMLAKAASAGAIPSMGGTTSSVLDLVEFLAIKERQRYRLPESHAMEVILPRWVRGAIRGDLANRNGADLMNVNDAQITAYFAARNVGVQFVYNWQDLAVNALGYPETFDILVYPAGTFVKGVSPIINLSAVYDAASLSVNTYTGLFMEEGVLVANRCYGALTATVPVCLAGITGEASAKECFTAAGTP